MRKFSVGGDRRPIKKLRSEASPEGPVPYSAGYSAGYHGDMDTTGGSAPATLPRPTSGEKPQAASGTHLEGFATFAQVLSSDPDLQVYRRFDRLASRNLVYLQAELRALEAQLEEFDQVDVGLARGAGDEAMSIKLSAKCWESFAQKAEQSASLRDQERMAIIKKIRETLAEYQEALLRQSAVLNLENPNPRVRNAVMGWFACNRPLVGDSRNLLDNPKDLVALRTPPEQDRLSLFLQDHLGYWLRDKPPKDGHNQQTQSDMYYFPENRMRHIVSCISVLLSAVLLVGAIVGLYFVKKPAVKLGMLAAFTTLFAASVGLLTNAKKGELYAATAAYAAVLVVFVSGNLGNE